MKRLLTVLIFISGFNPISIASQNDSSKSIYIKVIDVRDGKPMVRKSVMIWVDKFQGPVKWIKTNDEGVAEFPVSSNNSIIYANVNSFYSCTFSTDSHAQQTPEPFKISEIVQTGIQATNHCNDRKMLARPGELIFFIRPPHWWEKWKL